MKRGRKKFNRNIKRITITIWEDQYEEIKHRPDYSSLIRNLLDMYLTTEEPSDILLDALRKVYDTHVEDIARSDDKLFSLRYYAEKEGLSGGARDCLIVLKEKREQP